MMRKLTQKWLQTINEEIKKLKSETSEDSKAERTSEMRKNR